MQDVASSGDEIANVNVVNDYSRFVFDITSREFGAVLRSLASVCVSVAL